MAIDTAAEKAAAELAKREAEYARQESLRPDKEKLLAYAEALALVPAPEVTDHGTQKILMEARFRLKGVCGYLYAESEAL